MSIWNYIRLLLHRPRREYYKVGPEAVKGGAEGKLEGGKVPVTHARWERYTDRARAVMALANKKALETQAHAISEAHLMAAIAEEGSGVGASLLRHVGIPLGEFQQQVVSMRAVPEGPNCELRKLPMNSALSMAIHQAINEAVDLGDDYVGTEHLVLALSWEETSPLPRALAARDLTLDDMRSSLRALRCFSTATKAHAEGNWREAIAEYRRILELSPRERSAANNLAWLLATCPDGELRSGAEALRLMDWVITGKVTWGWWYFGTVAAAFAEIGRFDDAVSWGTRAMQMAQGSDAGRWEKWLAGFREHKPVREGVESKG